MRGQIANLIQALGARKSPAELAAMDEIYMYKSVPARPPRLQSRPSGPLAPTGCAECVARRCAACAPARRRRSRNNKARAMPEQSRCVCSCHRTPSGPIVQAAATDAMDASASTRDTAGAAIATNSAPTLRVPTPTSTSSGSAAASPNGSSRSQAAAGATPNRSSRPANKLLASGPSGMLHWLPDTLEPPPPSTVSSSAPSPGTVLVHTWPPRPPETPSGSGHESLATSVSHGSTDTLFKQKPHSRKPWFNF